MKKKSLLLKIFILLFSCMLVPLLMLSSINYWLTYRQMYTNLVDATQDDTGNIAYYLTMEFSEYFNMCYYVSQNNELKKEIGNYYAGKGSLEEMLRQTEEVISNPAAFKRVKYPFEYFLILENNAVITRYNHSGNIDYTKAYESMEGAQWYQELKRESQGKVLIFQDRDYINVNGGEKIYIARTIAAGDRQNAVFSVGISRYLIDKLLDNYQPSPDSSIFLYFNGKCLAKGEKNAISEEEAEIIFEGIGLEEKKQGKELIKETASGLLLFRKAVYFSDLPDTECYVVVITPAKTILKDIQYIKTTAAALIILCIGGACVLFYLAKKSIFDRIIVLKDAMALVEEGKMDVHLTPKEDEIGDLYQGFNDMADALNAAKEKAEKEEREKVSLELTMLQSQITPHFVRNSLNSIRWMAEMLGENGIARSILSLTRLLDYNIREFSEGVTMEDELDNLKEYIRIEKLRYGNKFTYEARMDERILPKKTLKLLLQPIVENCIIHGFENLDTIGHIKIDGRLEGERMVITVEDNGKGMRPEEMEKVLNPADNRQCSRIGIYNVNRRIQNHYGVKYGLELEQNTPQGVRVVIALPYR